MFLGAGEVSLRILKGKSGLPKGIPLEALNETKSLVEAFLKG